MTVSTIKEMYGAFGILNIHGTAGSIYAPYKDTFYAFKAQLEAFIGYLRTGSLPFPFSETEELMKIIIAGIKSREEGGREVILDEINT